MLCQGVAIMAELLLSRGAALENSFAQHLNSGDFAQTIGQLGAGLAAEVVLTALAYLLLFRMASRESTQLQAQKSQQLQVNSKAVGAAQPASAMTSTTGYLVEGFHPLVITRQTLHHVGWCLSLVTFSTIFGFAVLTDPSQSAAYIDVS